MHEVKPSRYINAAFTKAEAEAIFKRAACQKNRSAGAEVRRLTVHRIKQLGELKKGKAK